MFCDILIVGFFRDDTYRDMSSYSIEGKSPKFLKENMPIERFERFGIESLSDADLLAVILRTGTRNYDVFDVVSKVLQLNSVKKFGLPGLLRVGKAELLRIDGIGSVKAAQIMAVAELSRRIRASSALEAISFTSPESVSDYYMEELRNLRRERVIAVFLDTRFKRITESVLSIGTVNASVLDARELFSEALLNNAVSFILLHNHPSGDPTPGRDDITVTRKIKESAKMFELNFSDHIIIGDNRFFSMKEHGYL